MINILVTETPDFSKLHLKPPVRYKYYHNLNWEGHTKFI
jgi:hypothetical protein